MSRQSREMTPEERATRVYAALRDLTDDTERMAKHLEMATGRMALGEDHSWYERHAAALGSALKPVEHRPPLLNELLRQMAHLTRAVLVAAREWEVEVEPGREMLRAALDEPAEPE